MGNLPRATATTVPDHRMAGWLRRHLGRIRVTPGKITAVYVVLGATALYLSDFYLPTVLEQPDLARVQAIKGGIEVGITAAVIYGLTRRGRQQVAETNARLERQRGELDVLHRVLRHNLRNDLNVISGNASIVATETDEPELADRCDTIQHTVAETLRYTEVANKIRRVGEGDASDVDLSTRIPEIVADHRLVDDDVRIEMALENDLVVSVNDRFEDALGELIRNSIEHNASETARIRIEASVDPVDPDWILLEAADNGPGISDKKWEIIQEGEVSQLKHLDGLGLWFVYWTVQESGGELQIGQSDLGGSRFRIRLPRG